MILKAGCAEYNLCISQGQGFALLVPEKIIVILITVTQIYRVIFVSRIRVYHFIVVDLIVDAISHCLGTRENETAIGHRRFHGQCSGLCVISEISAVRL